MQYEEELKIQNNQITSKKYLQMQKVILLQILLFIFLIYIVILTNKNKEKFILDYNKGINSGKNINDYNPSNELSNKIKFLRILTNNDELEYKGIQECLLSDPDSKYCIYHLISPRKVIGKNRILLGEKYDGCYVLLDDFDNIKIAYSFGISTNIQFDKSLADRGIDVYMYDHKINSLPYTNPKFHWKKIGLCGINTNRALLKPLEQLMKENGHSNEKNMILKIDIEHWEWESINSLNEDILKKFKYIAIEYHFRDEKEFDNKNMYYNVLKKISKTHQSFYARCNGDRSIKINFGHNRICFILEVSYILREKNIFIKDDDIYPIYEFDYSVPIKGKLETNLNILKLFD